MIEIKGVIKKFKNETAISYKDMVFEDGRSYMLLGASGCGKSTLLNIIAGVLSADSGKVTVSGINMTEVSQKEKDKFRIEKIGYIFQDFKLIEEMTVMDNINILRLEGVDTSLAAELLEKLGMSAQKNKKIKHLSGGQKQRVAIIRALVKKPEIILADEPTGNLNFEVGETVIRELCESAKGKTLIAVTHDDRLAKYFDVVVDMNEITGLYDSQCGEGQKIMLKFALKNMAVKKVQVILIIVSIVISAGVGVLAYNVAEQVSNGITENAAYYSAIVGPSGSKTQLAMNTMYFAEEPVGTIPYSVVSSLKQDMRVTSVVPFAMADNYNGSSVVGTTSEFLAGKELAEGKMFDDTSVFQVVVGSSVAKVNQLSVGDDIFTSHSAANIGDVHSQSLKVVGILEETHTAYDKVVFTQLKSLWDIHGDHDEENEDEDADADIATADFVENQEESHAHENVPGTGNHGEESEEEHHHTNTVCAVLVRTKTPGDAMAVVTEYDGLVYATADGDAYSLQAIEPMDTVRDVLNDTNTTKYIVYVLCAIILIMNIMIISIITLLNMYNSAKEISLMRLIGISMNKINLMYILQNGIIGFISIALAFGFSRICLYVMQDYVSSMGVVLNMGKVYVVEWLILALIFIISVLPTVICTYSMSKKDGAVN